MDHITIDQKSCEKQNPLEDLDSMDDENEENGILGQANRYKHNHQHPPPCDSQYFEPFTAQQAVELSKSHIKKEVYIMAYVRKEIITACLNSKFEVSLPIILKSQIIKDGRIWNDYTMIDGDIPLGKIFDLLNEEGYTDLGITRTTHKCSNNTSYSQTYPDSYNLVIKWGPSSKNRG